MKKHIKIKFLNWNYKLMNNKNEKIKKIMMRKKIQWKNKIFKNCMKGFKNYKTNRKI